MTTANELELFETTNLSSVGRVKATGLDVAFPEGITWSEVLDCRIEPFSGKSIEENCVFAHQVHKFYILVSGNSDSSQD